jgi:hypothetical protein
MGHLENSPASSTPNLHVLCTKLSVLQVPLLEPTVEIHLLVRLGEALGETLAADVAQRGTRDCMGIGGMYRRHRSSASYGIPKFANEWDELNSE